MAKAIVGIWSDKILKHFVAWLSLDSLSNYSTVDRFLFLFHML